MSNIGCQMSDIKSGMSDVGCRMSDVESRMSDVGSRMSDVGCRVAPISFHTKVTYSGDGFFRTIECQF